MLTAPASSVPAALGPAALGPARLASAGVRARPGQGQRGHAAEAEPDRRHRPARLRAAGQGGQAGPRPADEQCRVVPQGQQAGHDPLPVPRHPGAEHVAGEHGIPDRRVAAGLLPGVRVEAGTAVDEQDPGPGTVPGLVPAEQAGQRQAEVVVRQVTNGDDRTGECYGFVTDHATEISNQFPATLFIIA